MFIQESTVLFDLSTLRDNIPLDAKQEAFVRTTISSTQDFIAGLDVKIQHIENELAELHKQRDAALESMMIPTALVAPVRRLPPEILGEIFQRCVPIEPNDIPFYTGHAPLLLTHVCHTWRQVAQGTPQLWTTLVTYGCKAESHFCSMWLQNSGSLPLEISVGVEPFRPVDDRDSVYRPWCWRIQRFLEPWLRPGLSDLNSQMVVEQLSRIRRFSLVCETDELSVYLPREAMTTLPSLQELCVKSTHSQDFVRRDYSFHNIWTPQLQTIVLNDCAELLLPILDCTSNLRNLEIAEDCTLDMFVDFVSRCSALERIYATSLDARYPRESMDMSDIVLSGLSHLVLEVSDIRSHNDLERDLGPWSHRTKSLQRLRTPNLQYADIRSLSHVERFLSRCIADSQSKLHTLTIRDTPLVATLLSDATSILTAVERIEFVYCESSAGFWESLTPAEDPPFYMWTLPKLKILSLEGVRSAPGHEGELLKFVERRAPPMRSQGRAPLEGTSYLGEIALSGCVFSMETFSTLWRLGEDREGFSITITDCWTPE